MFNDNNLAITLFFNEAQIKSLGDKKPIDFVQINNESNKLHLQNFLGKIYTPLRYNYIWDIRILSTFVKIIKFFDLPFRFDLDKKNLWRYTAKAYGTFFDKKKRSFVSFFSMGFKKNIGVLIPFIINYPSKSNLLHVVDWHKFTFLFDNTLNKISKNINNRLDIFTTKTLHPTKEFTPKLISIYPHIFSKRFHRSLNLSDIDVNPWVTTFDYRFWTNDIYDPLYKKSNLAKLDFSWGVHKSFITSSFFITSFDTRIILYPEFYFKYISKSNSPSRLFQLKNIFNKKYNKDFFFNIVNLFLHHYGNKINNKLYTFNSSLLNNINLNINYNINKKLIFFFLLFNKIFYNKLFILNLKKFLFLYKPSKLLNSILIKSYYYFRSKKYNAKSKLFYNFRLHYVKKLPINNLNSNYTSVGSILIQNIFRSFYSNRYYYHIAKIKSFWHNFFTFFLQNIKRRFIFFNEDNSFVFDSLLFLKKFIYFNKFLKKYLYNFHFNKRFNILNKDNYSNFDNISRQYINFISRKSGKLTKAKKYIKLPIPTKTQYYKNTSFYNNYTSLNKSKSLNYLLYLKKLYNL